MVKNRLYNFIFILMTWILMGREDSAVIENTTDIKANIVGLIKKNKIFYILRILSFFIIMFYMLILLRSFLFECSIYDIPLFNRFKISLVSTILIPLLLLYKLGFSKDRKTNQILVKNQRKLLVQILILISLALSYIWNYICLATIKGNITLDVKESYLYYSIFTNFIVITIVISLIYSLYNFYKNTYYAFADSITIFGILISIIGTKFYNISSLDATMHIRSNIAILTASFIIGILLYIFFRFTKAKRQKYNYSNEKEDF